MTKISRRTFLKISGATLVAGGLVVLGATPPAISLPEMDYGEDQKMGKNILVTYATKAGSTAEVASVIAETLSKSGARVDLRPVKDVPSLEGYQAVVIGSAVRIGQWLPDAKALIQREQAQLAGMPVAIFSVHMENLGEDEASRQARVAYTAPIHALVTPAAEAFFAGKIDLSKLSFLERMMSKMMKSVDEDRRDWEAIRAWAAGLALDEK
ncbi:flavodoxin [Longilinea arvoryzae]|uniref:Flavodoxin n=1 Tax=Longilinea arvoryzae TaxID=360412 RepID=A0A0S7BHG1_9CHLR|nr:flavodoxin domain-containing protein [Longilinea arvoryzae]GAP13307.1 flavodoxin [Longilinea arvoryzae]